MVPSSRDATFEVSAVSSFVQSVPDTESSAAGASRGLSVADPKEGSTSPGVAQRLSMSAIFFQCSRTSLAHVSEGT